MWKKFRQLVHLDVGQKAKPDQLFKPYVFTWQKQKLQVMQARPNDIANILELEARAYSGQLPWSAEIFRAELAKTNSLYLLAYNAATVVALAGIRFGKEEAHITNLAVDPAWQNQGLGTYFLHLLIDLARKKRCKLLSLEVRVDNQAARRLYESLGFTTTFVRPNYYQDVQQDGLNMVLRLVSN